MGENSISFYLNGRSYTVNNVDPTDVLNSWIRSQPGLTGTKSMCYEGGCGSCVVALQRPLEKVVAVNSCLLLMCTLDGCHITTVEGIGSRQAGYDDIQTRLAEFGGSQCGYCTPGFVMSMKSLLEENSTPTQQTIEDNFDGNICRCTGYRSILDAMKTFASDADKNLLKKCSMTDIEDLAPKKCTRRLQSRIPLKLQYLKLTNDTSTWVRPTSFLELKSVLSQVSTAYKLICGNTGSGVYKDSTSYPLYVDIGQVQEFRSITTSSTAIEFGASVTLNELSNFLSQNSTHSVTYQRFASHLKQVASKPIRNFGSWAGNVMLKHNNGEFPSDVCTLLEAAQASVKVYDVASDSYSLHSIFGSDGIFTLSMDKKVIASLSLPKIADDGLSKFFSQKITQRAQNAHAYVNAAFLATLASTKSEFSKVSLVFGGLGSSFHRAIATEAYLKGKQINSKETLQGAITTLLGEVSPVVSDQYRLNLTAGLLYKFYLSLCDVKQLGPGIASGIDSLQRPVSTGTQEYKTDPSMYPVSKNIPKLTAILQASGEAQYLSDSLPQTGDLFCNVVLAETGNADIVSIDTTEAEKIPGCVAVITKDNFPTDVKNSFLYPRDTSQPIVATQHVSHAGQVVAVIVAENFGVTFAIASAVKVTYANQKKVLLSNKDAIDAASFDGSIPNFVLGQPDQAIASSKHTVKGTIEFDRQYHFYMETHSCSAQCTEDGGLKVEASTQLQSFTQNSLSYAFGVPAHKIEMTTKRIGGAYGGKATNSQLTSCIAALASHVTKRPVHFHTTLETCMKMLGTRTPYTVDYEVGFDDDGVVGGMDVTLYTNSGCNSVDGEAVDPTVVTNFADSAYYCPNRRYKKFMLITNTPASTWCRAPASLQMTASADLVIEHVASYLGKDPVEVKLANLYKVGQLNLLGEPLMYVDIRSIYESFRAKYKISERMSSIETFNQNNRWKKKGLAVTPMKFRVDSATTQYGVLLSIYATDGSVLVSHGGIDSGQGINTKVIQAVAYKLGIPLDLVTVQRTSTITSANSFPTGGSITSENVCYSAMACCDILNSRIEPIRSKMSPSTTWQDLIAECFNQGVDLSVSNMSPPRIDYPYNSFGVTAAEVEYDVITGERQIVQVDLMFDCGVSMNPSVDIGQVEGAFIMGVGFWLTEKMVYDQTSGQLLTAGTWDYKPPSSQDIPITWNIELLPDAPNPLGVLRSKASGEPPLCMSICVVHALKKAVEATRKDRGITGYFPLPIPATVDALHDSSSLNPVSDFVLQ